MLCFISSKNSNLIVISNSCLRETLAQCIFNHFSLFFFTKKKSFYLFLLFCVFLEIINSNSFFQDLLLLFSFHNRELFLLIIVPWNIFNYLATKYINFCKDFSKQSKYALVLLLFYYFYLCYSPYIDFVIIVNLYSTFV